MISFKLDFRFELVYYLAILYIWHPIRFCKKIDLHIQELNIGTLDIKSQVTHHTDLRKQEKQHLEVTMDANLPVISEDNQATDNFGWQSIYWTIGMEKVLWAEQIGHGLIPACHKS